MEPSAPLPTLTELYIRICTNTLTEADRRLLESYMRPRVEAFRGTPPEIDDCLRRHSWRLCDRALAPEVSRAEAERIHAVLDAELGILLHNARPEMYPRWQP